MSAINTDTVLFDTDLDCGGFVEIDLTIDSEGHPEVLYGPACGPAEGPEYTVIEARLWEEGADEDEFTVIDEARLSALFGGEDKFDDWAVDRIESHIQDFHMDDSVHTWGGYRI
mgnify:CR=1 FL=1